MMPSVAKRRKIASMCCGPRRRGMRSCAPIFTTSKPLAVWGRVLHDEDLAQAIVERVLERGRLLHSDGPSMRTKHLGLDDPTAPEAPSEQVVSTPIPS